MFIVLGATGHVGSAVVQELLDRGLPVTAVTHNGGKVAELKQRGVLTAVVDVRDSDALRQVFQMGTRAFLLNPPADVSMDTDAEESATAKGIAAALVGSGLEKVVLESTFGAQPGDLIGDLSVLHDFEQAVMSREVPVTIQRGAYYFSNWDAQLEEARSGTLTTMFPPDLKIPMVAPADLGYAAAARLIEPFSSNTDIHLVEGPERYSVREVAETFAKALDRSVEVISLPPSDWIGAYQRLGFSATAATAYSRMTEATINGEFPLAAETEQGKTSLEAYIAELANRS